MASRNFLRYPTGTEFRKILADDHEWLVLTDTRLKVLVAERGDEREITIKTIKKAYLKIAQVDRINNPIKIFVLHTHPTDHPAPSLADWDTSFMFAKKKLLLPSGIDEVGFGVIGAKSIVIAQYPDDKKKLNTLGKKFTGKFEDNVNEYLKTRLKLNSVFDIPSVAHKIDAKTQKELMLRAYRASLNKSTQEEPNMKTKIVRKTRRFNMTRRR